MNTRQFEKAKGLQLLIGRHIELIDGCKTFIENILKEKIECNLEIYVSLPNGNPAFPRLSLPLTEKEDVLIGYVRELINIHEKRLKELEKKFKEL